MSSKFKLGKTITVALVALGLMALPALPAHAADPTITFGNAIVEKDDWANYTISDAAGYVECTFGANYKVPSGCMTINSNSFGGSVHWSWVEGMYFGHLTMRLYPAGTTIETVTLDTPYLSTASVDTRTKPGFYNRHADVKTLSPGETEVTTFSGSEPVVFSITSANANLFKIETVKNNWDGDSGKVSFKTVPAPGKYEITVKGVDSSGYETEEDSLLIVVNAANVPFLDRKYYGDRALYANKTLLYEPNCSVNNGATTYEQITANNFGVGRADFEQFTQLGTDYLKIVQTNDPVYKFRIGRFNSADQEVFMKDGVWSTDSTGVKYSQKGTVTSVSANGSFFYTPIIGYGMSFFLGDNEQLTGENWLRGVTYTPAESLNTCYNGVPFYKDSAPTNVPELSTSWDWNVYITRAEFDQLSQTDIPWLESWKVFNQNTVVYPNANYYPEDWTLTGPLTDCFRLVIWQSFPLNTLATQPKFQATADTCPNGDYTATMNLLEWYTDPVTNAGSEVVRGKINLKFTIGALPLDATAPTISGVGTATVANKATSVGTYTADEAVTWSISGGANSDLFEIDTTGALSFKSAAATGSYVVQISAADASGNHSEKTVTVTVSAATVVPAKTVTVTGFPYGKYTLTSKMKAAIAALVKANPKMTRVTITGRVKAKSPAANSKVVATAGATAVLKYLKTLKPKLIVTLKTSVEKRPGSTYRDVVISVTK